MKLNKLKNKINAFKSEIKRNKTLSFDEWLKVQGLEENAENRRLYGLYAIANDEENKQADKTLSTFIGKIVFFIVLIALLIILTVQETSASDIYAEDGNNIYNPPRTEINYINLALNPDDECILTLIYLYDMSAPPYPEQSYALVTNSKYFYNRITSLLPENFSSMDNELKGQTLYSIISEFTTELIYVSPSVLVDLYYKCDYEIEQDELLYNRGFHEGLTEGESLGYTNGVTDGYDNGYNVGKTDGYNVGYTNGTNEGEIAKQGIYAIFDAPIKVLTSLLDFEVFGINLLSIFKVIITLAILGFISKFILSVAL